MSVDSQMTREIGDKASDPETQHRDDSRSIPDVGAPEMSKVKKVPGREKTVESASPRSFDNRQSQSSNIDAQQQNFDPSHLYYGEARGYYHHPMYFAQPPMMPMVNYGQNPYEQMASANEEGYHPEGYHPEGYHAEGYYFSHYPPMLMPYQPMSQNQVMMESAQMSYGPPIFQAQQFTDASHQDPTLYLIPPPQIFRGVNSRKAKHESSDDTTYTSSAGSGIISSTTGSWSGHGGNLASPLDIVSIPGDQSQTSSSGSSIPADQSQTSSSGSSCGRRRRRRRGRRRGARRQPVIIEENNHSSKDSGDSVEMLAEPMDKLNVKSQKDSFCGNTSRSSSNQSVDGNTAGG